MNANNLLLWMSTRGEGSWSQFRSAVEEFLIEREDTAENGEYSDDMTGGDLPIYQFVRLGLQRLAHVEFFTSGLGKDWCVVPPVLAISNIGDDWVGIVCGARFPALAEMLNQLGGSISWDNEEIPGMPDRIRIVSSDINELRRTANKLGLTVQISAPLSLLAAIPSVIDPRSRLPSEAPVGLGWLIERFDPSSLRWVKLNGGDQIFKGTNLFRYRMKYQRFYFLQWHGRTFKVQVQVGKYAVLRHRRVRNIMFYNPEKSILSFPISCRPPMLIERAIVLCSGLLPRLDFQSNRLEYTQIPENVTRLVAGLLCQEVQVHE